MKFKKVLEKVSFITTVYNEEKDILIFLNSLMDQRMMPAEIVIVDGGSIDNTLNTIIEYFKGLIPETMEAKKSQDFLIYEGKLLFDTRSFTKIKIIEKKGANISQGRNIAIINTESDFICVSDAGCILDKNWIYEITKNISSTNSINAVGGFNFPIIKNFLHACLAVCIMPRKIEINPKKYMPSSRNLGFKKISWLSVGGYPENMDYGEDMKFNFNIRTAGFKIIFNPDAIVYWKMRENLKDVFRQFFRYAKGDAIGNMYFYRHLIRFFSIFIFIAIIVISVIFSPWFLTAFALLFFIYTFKPYRRINHVWKNSLFYNTSIFKKKVSIITAIFSIPLLLIYLDIAKIFGYIYGIFHKKNI